MRPVFVATCAAASARATCVCGTAAHRGCPPPPPWGVPRAELWRGRDVQAEKKVNLGIGAYRDEAGKPWVLECVKAVSVLSILAVPTLMGQGNACSSRSFQGAAGAATWQAWQAFSASWVPVSGREPQNRGRRFLRR